MKRLTVVLLVLTSVSAFAGGGGGHHEAGVPYGMLVSQAINFSLLGAIIYFFAGGAIGTFFRSKKEEFLSSVEQASKALANATHRKQDITDRLAKLRQNYKSDIEEATNKAGELFRVQVSDARNQAQRIGTDTDNALAGELQKAVEHLRVETFSKSAELAEKNLSTHLTDDRQKAWNDTFSDRLKGVH